MRQMKYWLRFSASGKLVRLQQQCLEIRDDCGVSFSELGSDGITRIENAFERALEVRLGSLVREFLGFLKEPARLLCRGPIILSGRVKVRHGGEILEMAELQLHAAR